MAIPLIFIHAGKSDWLELCIRQARHSNPDVAIYLLGDSHNSYLSGCCEFSPYSDHADQRAMLRSVYRHLSGNSAEFELFCLERWFVARTFMRSRGLDRAFIIDSDFLLYEPIGKWLQEAPELLCSEAAYCIPDQQYGDYLWLASGHLAMVTPAFLDKFCAFILNRYQEGMDQLLEKTDHGMRNQARFGGISDMSVLYLYALGKTATIYNLLLPVNGLVTDLNIGSGMNFRLNEFVTGKLCKMIRIENGMPYGTGTDGNSYRFAGLHFQGNAKFYLVDHYTGPFCAAVARQKFHKWYCHLVDAMRAMRDKNYSGRYLLPGK